MLRQRVLTASRIGRLQARRFASGAGSGTGDYYSELAAVRAHAAGK